MQSEGVRVQTFRRSAEKQDPRRGREGEGGRREVSVTYCFKQTYNVVARSAPRNGPSQYYQEEIIRFVCQLVITLIVIDTRREVVWVKGGYIHARVSTCVLPQPSVFFARTHGKTYGLSIRKRRLSKKKRGGGSLRSIEHRLESLSLRRGRKHARCS